MENHSSLKKILGTLSIRYSVTYLILTQILTGCLFGSGGGSGSVTGTNQPGTQSPFISNASITIVNIYPTSEGSSWVASGTKTDATGRIYVKGNSVSVLGTCSRGVSNVKVSVAGSFYDESATCGETGTFVWTKSFSSSSEADYTFDIIPFLADGTALSNAAISKNLRVDDSAPSAPAITAPSSSGSFSATGNPDVTISGTVSSDTIFLMGPSSTEVSVSSSAWTAPVVLIPDSSTVYNFYSYDRAGNQSAAGSIAISYTPSLFLKSAGAYIGNSNVSDSGTNYSLESTISFVPLYSTDSGTSYSLDTGLNRVINQVRSDQ
jgi:hypothetical protein